MAHEHCHLCRLILKSAIYHPPTEELQLWASFSGSASHTVGIRIDTRKSDYFTNISISRAVLCASPLFRHKNLTTLLQTTGQIANLAARLRTPYGSFSEASLEQIKIWMRDCKLNHRICQDARNILMSDPNAPRKPIEIWGSQIAYLRETKDLPESITYATLSQGRGVCKVRLQRQSKA